MGKQEVMAERKKKHEEQGSQWEHLSAAPGKLHSVRLFSGEK